MQSRELFFEITITVRKTLVIIHTTLHVQAYILINCNAGSESSIISELKEITEISEINGIWGKYDIFLKISTQDPNGIEQIVKRLRNHPDITDTYTMNVLYGQGGSIEQAT